MAGGAQVRQFFLEQKEACTTILVEPEDARAKQPKGEKAKQTPELLQARRYYFEGHAVPHLVLLLL